MPANGEKPQEGNQPVANEIERIGFDGLGPGEEATNHLNHAITDVEEDDDPERLLVRRCDVGALSQQLGGGRAALGIQPVEPEAQAADCLLECR